LYSELLAGTDEGSLRFYITITDDLGTVVLNYSANSYKGARPNATFTASQDGIYRVRVTREGNYNTVYKFSFSQN